MNIKTKVKFHNKFNIEIRDKDTGELKQTGYAENIVLNNMYSRLCTGNSYFNNIHFGTGDGLLTPERTTLFNFLGTKTAVLIETIKAYPTSQWTKTATVNPEEYVGNTITEVGISFGTGTTNLVTHAMIKDSEGNPLALSKTDLDVLVIYATVFITLQGTPDVWYTNMPENNGLLNYLTGASDYSKSIAVGIDRYRIDERDPWIKGSIQTKTGTIVNDTANRKRTISTRFGIAEGNGYVSEVGLGSIARICIPESTVLNGYNLTAHPIGTGDSITTKFNILPRPTDLIVKNNGYIVTDYTVETSPSHNFKIMESASFYIGMSGDVCIYKGNKYTLLDNTLIYDYKVTNLEENVKIIFSEDRQYFLSYGYSNSKNQYIYKIDPITNKYEPLHTIATTGTTSPPGDYFSFPTNKYLVSSTGTSTMRFYKNIDDVFTIIHSISGRNLVGGFYDEVSNEGMIAYGTTIETFEMIDDVYISKNIYPSIGTIQDQFIQEGIRYIITINNHVLCIYKLENQILTFVTDTATLLPRNDEYNNVITTMYYAGSSGDGSSIMVRDETQKIFYFLKFKNNEIHLINTSSENIVTAAQLQISNDGKYVIFGSTSYNSYNSRWSFGFSLHSIEPNFTNIIFNTPPATDVLITADFKVPYLPKNADYVLDVTFETIFGEA